MISHQSPCLSLAREQKGHHISSTDQDIIDKVKMAATDGAADLCCPAGAKRALRFSLLKTTEGTVQMFVVRCLPRLLNSGAWSKYW